MEPEVQGIIILLMGVIALFWAEMKRAKRNGKM